MLAQPVGTQVTLDTMMVEEVGPDFVLLREPFNLELVVPVQASASVKKWQSVEARGTSVTPKTGENMVVTATWNGQSRQKEVQVNAERLALWATPQLEAGIESTVYARLTLAGEPVSDADITFVADSGGSFDGQPSITATTAGNGIAQARFTADVSGTPKVTARHISECGRILLYGLEEPAPASCFFHGSIVVS